MGTPTLAAWLEEWAALRRHHLEASSVVSYRWMADSYLVPHLGDLPLDQLDVRTIEGAYATLLASGGRGGRPLAPRTVAYTHAVLHRALVDAVRLGVIATNVAADATVPRRAVDGRDPRPLRVWDAEQVRHFLASTADHPLADLWSVALGTGLRRGELLGLRHRDVEVAGATLTVATALTVVDGIPRWKAPKTGRTRTLSLDPRTLATLQRRLVRSPDRPAGATSTTSTSRWPQRPEDADRPVFADTAGQPLDPGRISQAWRTLMRQVELPPIRLHDLRHTHATLLLAAGVPIKVVSERLGHTKIAMTLDIYAHVLPAQDRAAATALGDLFDGPQVTAG